MLAQILVLVGKCSTTISSTVIKNTHVKIAKNFPAYSNGVYKKIFIKKYFFCLKISIL